MERIEVTETNTVYKYKAIDGTVFPTDRLCKEYEETVACVLRSRLCIKEYNAWDFCKGYEDNIVEVVSGKKDDVLNYAAYCKRGSIDKSTENMINEIIKTYRKSPLLIFKNNDGDMYFMEWSDNFVSSINDFCKSSKDETC